MPDEIYKMAGVDLDAALDIKRRIKDIVVPTHGPEVLGDVGGFGALYQLSGYRQPVLVSSTDGVGTKLKVASLMNAYAGLGEDLVNACVNDVIVCGAKPLFFLDYIATGKLASGVVQTLLGGMAVACRESGCALIGGETAQMSGIYKEAEFELAGFALGVVEKSEMPDHASIREGDLLLGIPSTGLHTNGYSLVRYILNLDEDPSPLHQFHSVLGSTLGESLLAPHRSYYPLLNSVFSLVKGMIHVTGGGLIENVPRVLPENLAARFDTTAWQIPPIFTLLQEMGGVSRDEMYRVFNMGLGIILVCEEARVGKVSSLVSDARVVGEIVSLEAGGRVIL